MTAERQPMKETHTDHDASDEQRVIDEVGREGTVTTSGGETSLGTTPIGVGSVEPVGGHREASDRIMGEQDAGADAEQERRGSR